MTRRAGVIFATLLCAGFAVVATPSPRAHAQVPDSLATLFAGANGSYESGDYDDAIASYERLVADGVVSADLDYNLGNAYYKVGSVGKAILYYERARRLAPRDEDIAENLMLARSLVRDRQFVGEGSWLKRTVMWPYTHLSTHELFLLATLWYGLLTIALLGLIFRHSPFVSRVYPKISMVSPGRLLGLDKSQDFVLAVCTTLVLTVATGLAAYGKHHTQAERLRGVIVSDEVAVYSGPSKDSTLQFKIHEGTTVRVARERSRWAQVSLPGGLSGWIPKDTVERI